MVECLAMCELTHTCETKIQCWFNSWDLTLVTHRQKLSIRIWNMEPALSYMYIAITKATVV